MLQKLGARGGIVMDTTPGSAAATSPLFAMSGRRPAIPTSVPAGFVIYYRVEEEKGLCECLLSQVVIKFIVIALCVIS
jgi:hypothetical protein